MIANGGNQIYLIAKLSPQYILLEYLLPYIHLQLTQENVLGTRNVIRMHQAIYVLQQELLSLVISLPLFCLGKLFCISTSFITHYIKSLRRFRIQEIKFVKNIRISYANRTHGYARSGCHFDIDSVTQLLRASCLPKWILF